MGGYTYGIGKNGRICVCVRIYIWYMVSTHYTCVCIYLRVCVFFKNNSSPLALEAQTYKNTMLFAEGLAVLVCTISICKLETILLGGHLCVLHIRWNHNHEKPAYERPSMLGQSTIRGFKIFLLIYISSFLLCYLNTREK